jgi:glycerol-3-phosphate O-acyltransferase / dihydroxyacetone phosphate acyltransferase
MSRFYDILKTTLESATDLFFVEIQTTGTELIPPGAPLLFAANHPNSIMDTVLLATQTDRKVHYLARSGLFTNPFAARLFELCGAIPICRDPKNPQANKDTFRRAFEVLQQGGCVGIFPEGRNSLERGLLELKTGAARIALGAEAANTHSLGLVIIPVGLNFTNRDRFMSKVLIRFGEPIRASDWVDEYRSDERAAVRSLTQRIGDDLRGIVTHIEDNDLSDLVRDINTIYGHHLMEEIVEDTPSPKPPGESSFRDSILSWMRGTVSVPGDLDESFWIEQRIADAVMYFQSNDPEALKRVRIKTWQYSDHLQQVRLKHGFDAQHPAILSARKEIIKLTSYAILFLPAAAWGAAHNLPPYLVSRFFSRRAPDEAIRAFTALIAGLIFFPAWYTSIAWSLSFLLNAAWPTVLLYLLSLPPMGFFALRYRQRVSKFRGRILARTLFRAESRLIRQLVRERDSLLSDLDGLRDRFLEAEARRLTAVQTAEPADETSHAPETNDR